ncbi:response regulator [Methanoregula sp.]|uniref:response regulator n=1 Tax=Methanoregula sp. TaxID=2052170 RepID=UPI002369BDCA|nr:response regulator [Methanoregula sp.]MDD1685816.1 PAS domain S-box protein [Methanoregula sp.]
MISLLYVDDEPELLKIAKIFLEREGDIFVTTTTSSMECLDMLADQSFDAIISDYQMPGMDGIELLKQVRGRGLSTPFILFTGKGREEVVIEAINHGADFYLQKGGAARPQFAELRHKILVAMERRQAIDALRDSEQKLADIINFLPDATFAINTNGQVIAWNKAIEAMTGIPASLMMGRGEYEYAIPFYRTRRPILIDLVLAPDDPYEQAHYYNHCHDGITLTAGTTIENPDCTGAVHIWAKASRLYDKNGKITGAIESVRDVTEQMKVDQTLRESETKYRELVENANSIIIKMDPKGTITFFNEFAQRLFGFTTEEIIGKPAVGTIVPTHESGSNRDLADMIENIIAHPDDYTNNENENITKTGDRVWIHWWNKPLYDKKGVIEGVLCVGTDITARKHFEDDLRAENEKNRGLMDNASDAIFIMDAATGMFTDANRRALELVGRSLPELRDMHLTGIFPDGFHETYMNYFSHAAHEGSGSHSLGIVDRKGRVIPAIASFTSITLEDRLHVMGIFHDISDIQMAQDALKLANRKLNLLSDITRHDIRNKLTVLGGYLELSRGLTRDPDYSMYIRKIQDIVRTIGENIEFTGLYQNLGVTAPDWQNVHDIFFHACASIDIRTISVQSDTGALEIFADPLLERAFYNIAENAVTHGGKVSLIRISAHETPDGAMIVIEDNGTGVLPSEKEQIFTKGYGKNTGLGLFLVREILSITGITIRETGEYHKGARFELGIPYAACRFPQNQGADRCHIHLVDPDAKELPHPEVRFFN